MFDKILSLHFAGESIFLLEVCVFLLYFYRKYGNQYLLLTLLLLNFFKRFELSDVKPCFTFTDRF